MNDVNLFAVMFNLHAEIIYCNGHFILMTGPAVDEVMGRGWNEIFASPGMGDSPCPSRIGHWWSCPNRDTLVQDFLIPCSARLVAGTTKTQAEPEMHFLTSLTVIFGFTVVVGLAFGRSPNYPER
jgi:hypothetical protein